MQFSGRLLHEKRDQGLLFAHLHLKWKLIYILKEVIVYEMQTLCIKSSQYV